MPHLRKLEKRYTYLPQAEQDKAFFWATSTGMACLPTPEDVVKGGGRDTSLIVACWRTQVSKPREGKPPLDGSPQPLMWLWLYDRSEIYVSTWLGPVYEVFRVPTPGSLGDDE